MTQIIKYEPLNETLLVRKDNNLFRCLSAEAMALRLEELLFADWEDILKIVKTLEISDVKTIFKKIGSFFTEELKINALCLEEIESLNLRDVSRQLLKYTNTSLPLIKTEFEKEVTKKLISKLARVLLHDLLFPAIIEENPNLALALKNLIKRNLTSVCRIEGWDAQSAFESLKVDDLPGEQKIGFIVDRKNTGDIKESETGSVSMFFVPNFSEEEGRQLARNLVEYKVIAAINPFVEFLFSQGRNFQPVKCHNKKLMAHLLFRLYHTSIDGKKNLLKMNFGKKYFQFAEQNMLDGDGGLLLWGLARMSSDVNNNPKGKKNSIIIKEVDYIIKSVFKLKN